MSIVKEHVIELLDKDIRLDKRKLHEYRKPIVIEYGISDKAAEGSARVKIGETEVVAGVKMEVGMPYPDNLDQGTIIVNVELLPLSDPDFETGPPSIEAIELARAGVDRGIRESGCIDFKKLCIKEGEKVWTILIDIYSINNDGNLADAIGLAALAALKDAKFPKYDIEKNKIDYKEKTKKLILKEFPIPVTVFKIKDKFIVDPILDEEYAADARLTIATVEDGRICALQKGGESFLTTEEIDKMIEIATEKSKELRKLLKGE